MNIDKKQFKKYLSELMDRTNNKQELYDKLVDKKYPPHYVAEKLNFLIHKKDIERNKLLFYSYAILLILDSIIFFIFSNRDSAYFTSFILLQASLFIFLRKCNNYTFFIFLYIIPLLLTISLFIHPSDILSLKGGILIGLAVINFALAFVFNKKLCHILSKNKEKYFDKEGNLKYKLSYKLK